jgi:uncharacterized protein (TIGR04255 family)
MYEQVCYQKSFLKQVIVRVDFATPLDSLEKNVPSKLLNSIVESFPIIEPADVIAHELSLDGNAFKSKQTMNKQWNYFAKDRSRQLTLTPQYIFVLYTAYRDFEETKEQFGIVVNALLKAFPDTKASRFGLRYINEIELPLDDPTAWNDYITPTLLGSRDFFGPDDAITRLISIAELKYNDVGVRFQFGMPNPDYPAPLKRPLFILDLDASVSQAHDLTEVMQYMDETHSRIQSVYERSITNTLREKMNARPVQE